jgi:hypothetical protein
MLTYKAPVITVTGAVSGCFRRPATLVARPKNENFLTGNYSGHFHFAIDVRGAFAIIFCKAG